MESVLTIVKDIAVDWGPQVLAAIAILIIGRWLAALATRLLRTVMTKARQDEMLVRFVGSIAYYTLLVVVLIAAIAQLGVQTTSLIAVFGAAGLAVGLALQGSLSNFAAGVMLIVFKPFKVGDYIEAAGTAGTVEEMMIFNTRLKTPDNRIVWVPNGNIFEGNIVNYNASDTRRVDMVFSCSYEDDIVKAKSILEELVKNDARVLEDPAPAVTVAALADSSIDFNVRPWAKTGDYWGLYWDMQEQVKLRFDEEGISIPYPQRHVHVHGAGAAGLEA